MLLPRNTVLQGHVLDKLKELPNDCVDVVVTSTPYYGLRDYGPDCVSIWDSKADCEHDWLPYNFSLHNGRGDAQKSGKFSQQENVPDLKLSNHTCSKCGAWKGQLGLEPHPSMFIEHLAQVFLEIKRCLKPSGSLWLNLGDTYFGGNGKAGRPDNWEDLESKSNRIEGHAPGDFLKERNKLRSNWLQPKQKMMMPARVAIALQDQGWILRNELVWHKVNHMPESCRDRLTRSWESVFFFVKSDRYYFDLDAIRKPHTRDWSCAGGSLVQTTKGTVDSSRLENAIGHKRYKGQEKSAVMNPCGANPGDVWSMTNEGLKEEHFAAFPQKLVKRIFECSMPKEICDQCGKPKTRIVKKNGYIEGNGGHVCRKALSNQHRTGPSSILVTQANSIDRSFLGWTSCDCGSSFHSGLVLDPFAGAGTSLLVAHKMGFDWLGIEIVPKYCEIIEKRIERHGKIRLDGFLQSGAMAPNDAMPKIMIGENKNV